VITECPTTSKKHVATPICEIAVSEKNNLVITNTLQGSEATLLRCGGIFDY